MKMFLNQFRGCEIQGFHDCYCESYYLLGCYAVLSGRRKPSKRTGE
jgi:hypothetical protein